MDNLNDRLASAIKRAYIPELHTQAAQHFESQIKHNKPTIDFSKQIKSMQSILKRSSL